MRSFDYESVHKYYTEKTRSSVEGGLKALPTTGPAMEAPLLSTTIFPTLHAFSDHLHEVQSRLNVTLKTCKKENSSWFRFFRESKFDWPSVVEETKARSLDKATHLWQFREYAFSLLLIHMGRILGPSRLWADSIKRDIPRDVDIRENRFAILGSNALTSDIDVTIKGPHVSVLISVFEDVCTKLSEKYGIPMNCMDIQCYGDYHVLNDLYVNVSLFSKDHRIDMLRYAYISYFRSLDVTKGVRVSPLARRIGELYLERVGEATPLNVVIESAFDEWAVMAPGGVLNRESFYLEMKRAEVDSEALKPYVERKKSVRFTKGGDVSYLANDVFFTIARADVHSPESYVLPSTAVIIVDVEQALGGVLPHESSLPSAWFVNRVQIGVDEFAYLASAVEQAGYVEHYIRNGAPCNKKVVKYFGRLTRSLLHADCLDASYIPIYTALDAHRKADDGSKCPHNIHTLLKRVTTDLGAKPKRQTRRRQQQQQQQHHKVAKEK